MYEHFINLSFIIFVEKAMKNIIYLLIFITVSSFAQKPNPKLTGLWKGTDLHNNIGYFNFDSEGYVTIINHNDTIGGKSFVQNGSTGSIFYKTDESSEPYSIDIIISKEGKDSTKGLLGIYKFDEKNRLVLCIGFEETDRPVEFNEKNTMIFEKIGEKIE